MRAELVPCPDFTRARDAAARGRQRPAAQNQTMITRISAACICNCIPARFYFDEQHRRQAEWLLMIPTRMGEQTNLHWLPYRAFVKAFEVAGSKSWCRE